VTPSAFVLWAGVAASAGLGYQPAGASVTAVVRAPHVEARTNVDATPKTTSGAGWNVSQDVLARDGRLLAGVGVRIWSGGDWTKVAARLLAAVELAPGVRVVAESTLDQSDQGAWTRSLGVDVERGRVRLRFATVRYTQANTGVGVRGSAEVRVWGKR